MTVGDSQVCRAGPFVPGAIGPRFLGPLPLRGREEAGTVMKEKTEKQHLGASPLEGVYCFFFFLFFFYFFPLSLQM